MLSQLLEGGTATTTTGGATSVLSNDSDPDGDTIQLIWYQPQ